MLHLVNQTKLLFWKKMYTRSNVLLYTLSRYAGVPSRFMAVASQYGINSLQQTVGTVKFAVCMEVFYRDSSYLECVYFVLFSVLYLCVCAMCFMFVFYIATFWCSK